MARLLLVAGFVALGVAAWVATRPVVNPGVQDCGSSAEFFLRDTPNVLMRPGAPGAPADPREAVALEEQPTCRDRAATELARAGFAAGAFVGLTLLGIVVGLVDDRVALWRAPRFETYLRELPLEGRVRRGLVPRVEVRELAGDLPPIESTEVTALVVGSVAAFIGLPFAATIEATGSVVSDGQPVWLVIAVLFTAVAFVASAGQRFVLDPTGQPAIRWLEGVVGSAWQGGLRPLVAWFGIDLHRLRRAGARRAPSVLAVQSLQAISAGVHGIVFVFATLLWVRADRPVVDPRGPMLILLGLLVVLTGNGITRLPNRWRAYAVHPHLATVRELPSLGFRAVAGAAGGALVAIVARALVLQCCLVAFGAGAPFPWILAVVTVATVLGAVGPFPHGAGITEGATMLLLVWAAGVGAAPAVAAALAARLITFWLPMVPGWFVARRIR